VTAASARVSRPVRSAHSTAFSFRAQRAGMSERRVVRLRYLHPCYGTRRRGMVAVASELRTSPRTVRSRLSHDASLAR
jgi:hypothetical protein